MTEKIPISRIEENNLRIGLPVEFDDIAASLASQGQLAPVRVRPHPTQSGMYQLIFGNRRVRAAKALGWTTIDAEIVRATDPELISMALAENIDRKDFTDYEKGVLLERLKNLTGLSYQEIAKLVGKSSAFVSHHISMLKLFPEETLDPAETSKVLSLLSERHARILATIGDPIERWNTAKFVVSAGLSVRELEQEVFLINRTRDHDNLEPKKTSRNEKKKIQSLMREIIGTIADKDVRPYFEAKSTEFYSCFSQYPPFSKMDLEQSKDYLVDNIRNLGNFRQKIEDMEIRVFGKIAFACLLVKRTLYEYENRVLYFRGTVIFRKEKDWRIIHEHWSSCNPTDLLSILSAHQGGSIWTQANLTRVKLGV